jgi:hypothetical protein
MWCNKSGPAVGLFFAPFGGGKLNRMKYMEFYWQLRRWKSLPFQVSWRAFESGEK